MYSLPDRVHPVPDSVDHPPQEGRVHPLQFVSEKEKVDFRRVPQLPQPQQVPAPEDPLPVHPVELRALQPPLCQPQGSLEVEHPYQPPGVNQRMCSQNQSLKIIGYYNMVSMSSYLERSLRRLPSFLERTIFRRFYQVVSDSKGIKVLR